jgi:DNA-directed RNA polymerase sigma subunit (sigma70/sigma32)
MEIDQFDDKTAFFHNITQCPVSLDTPCNDDESECKLSDIIEEINDDYRTEEKPARCVS